MSDSDEFDYKSWCKHFLPAILAFVVAVTGWVSNQLSSNSNEESRAVAEAKLNSRITAIELQAAELKGEQKSQRELLTELRLDIREIKTLLENQLNKEKK